MKKKTGRPTEFGERKVIASITITPTLLQFLKSSTASVSHQIESSMRNTIAFIEWSRSREDN